MFDTGVGDYLKWTEKALTAGDNSRGFRLLGDERYPTALTGGPDGNVWFLEMTEAFGSPDSFQDPHPYNLARISPNGQITEFRIPTEYGDPAGITTGPDGNVWFTEAEGNKIGVITPGLLAIGIELTHTRVHGHSVKIDLACAGGGADSVCVGSLHLRYRLSRAKTIGLAYTNYLVESNAEQHVTLRLSNKTLALLRRHHLLIVQASATLLGGQGATRNVALRLHGHRHSHRRGRNH